MYLQTAVNPRPFQFIDAVLADTMNCLKLRCLAKNRFGSHRCLESTMTIKFRAMPNALHDGYDSTTLLYMKIMPRREVKLSLNYY